MPPTPLSNGAQVQFLDLANPDTSAEKMAIYAKYYESSSLSFTSNLGSSSPGLMPGGGSTLVKLLLLGDDLVPSSHIIATTTLTEAQVLAAGVPQAVIDDIHASATGIIRYYQYRYVNDTSPAPTPAEYHSTASANITVLPALGGDHGVVTIQDTLGYKRYFSVPVSAGNPATVTVSGMEAGVATFTIQLMVSGAPVANGTKRYTLSKTQTRNISFPETGPSSAFPLAQITRMLLTQANQNDDGTGVIIAGRAAMLQAYFWDPQNRAGTAGITARVDLPSGGSQSLPITPPSVYFSNLPFAPEVMVPPALVQPGATFTVEARLSDGTILSRTYAPNIQQGKRVTLHVYEVSPGLGFSGVPVARSEAAMRDQLVSFAENQLPVSGFNIDIRPGFPWPPSNPGTLWSDPGYTIGDLANLGGVMDQVAAAEGHPRTDGNVYIAIINGRYAQTTVRGFTAGKGFPGIAMFMFSQEFSRNTLAHELGHAYWLGHAPSPGATSDPNPIDWDYPYGGDSMIAFSAWGGPGHGVVPTTVRDLMAYGDSYTQWISDFNWARFFERTFDPGLPFLAGPGSLAPTILVPKIKAGGTLIIGPKEAQALADYVDAVHPMGCGVMTQEELDAAKAQARQAPVSPIPANQAGVPLVMVKTLVRPKRDIPTYEQHAPSELERLLALPEAPHGGKR